MRTSFDRNGVAVSFETTGSGESVTLIHGVGSNLESWDKWCQRFGIARSQKRIAARTQPSALVPVPSPKPWPTFG